MIEKLNYTLQENILTLLCHDETHGRIVSTQVDANLFEGDYRDIALEAVNYWRKYNMPPGDHTADLFSEIIDDPKNKRYHTYRRILTGMRELSASINVAYVMDKLTTFNRMQKLKIAIVSSAEKLTMKQETAVSEIEEVWNDLLRVRENNYDPGMRLTEISRMLKYLEEQQLSEFTTGINELDVRNVVPERGKVLLFLAPAGKGKTWWLINLAKQALLQRKKVVFISLEMGEEELIQRCYQNLFSVPSRDDDDNNWVRTLEFDDERQGRLKGFGEEMVEPDFNLDSDMLRAELETRLSAYGSRYENLIVKRFAPRSVNINDLRSYLDNLEVVERFIPDLLILDYIGRIKTNINQHRLNLGTEFEDFRGLVIERHMAGATAHQVSKKGATANQVRSTHVSEDFSFIMTADKVITYSATEAEIRYGVARLFVAKARSEKDQFGVVITQKYALGQFCLQSALLTTKYYDFLKAATGSEETDATEPEEDDDD